MDTTKCKLSEPLTMIFCVQSALVFVPNTLDLLRDPFECTKCGVMFCKSCIDKWLRCKKECPNRCKMAQDTTIRPSSHLVQKLIGKYEIRCSICGEKFKISQIDDHIKDCRTPKCANPLCRKILEDSKQRRVPKALGCTCSETCRLVVMFQSELASAEKQTPVEIFNKFIRRIKTDSDSQGLSRCLMDDISISENYAMQNSGPPAESNPSSHGINEFVWDITTAPPSVMFFAERRIVLLNDSDFAYRNVFGTTGFMGGSQYWEIIIDSMTQNELKIGVSKERSNSITGAFSDSILGYAYYGLGELRHGENIISTKYGKKFRKSGIIGVYLNMDQGTLSFSLNGEYFGIAFKNKELTSGPIYPAVALLRISGIILVTGKPVPSYFKD